MKKKEVVKKKEEFNKIITNCPFIKNYYFVIYIKEKEEENPKFGIAISKKVGNAVIRNKLKRRLRVIIDNNKNLFKKHKDYIIMIKKSCLNASFQELSKNLNELIKENK